MDILTLLSSDDYHTRFFSPSSTPPRFNLTPKNRPALHDIQLNSRSQSSCAAFLGRELKLSGVVVKTEPGCEVVFTKNPEDRDGDPDANELMREKDGEIGVEPEDSESLDGDINGDVDVEDEVQNEDGSDEMNKKNEAAYATMSDLQIIPIPPLTPPVPAEEDTTDNISNMRLRSGSGHSNRDLRSDPKLILKAEKDPNENEEDDRKSPPKKKQKSSPRKKSRRPSHLQLLSDEETLAVSFLPPLSLPSLLPTYLHSSLVPRPSHPTSPTNNNNPSSAGVSNSAAHKQPTVSVAR
ncbi:hypothetical protein ONS96_008352 [Cadophora gregata f. sp. sojae]|nr:hypothetical protein ONS96_008352 [Cadophora gregata f. sp. sojae]